MTVSSPEYNLGTAVVDAITVFLSYPQNRVAPGSTYALTQTRIFTYL